MAQPSVGLIRQFFRFFFSLVLLVPLAGHLVAAYMGYQIFLLADGRIQSALAALVLLSALGVHLAEWVRPGRTVYLGVEAVVVLVAGGLYGYSLYQTYFQPVQPPGPLTLYYQDAAALGVLLHFARLVRAYRRVRRAQAE